jgi:Flp pilus assembly protein TadD
MTAKTRKQQLEEMLAEEPNDTFLHYGLAMEHVSAGDYAAAVERFRKLLEVDAKYVPAYMQGGLALQRLNRDAEARELWQRGIAQARQQGNLHAAEEMQGMLEGLD